MIDEKKIEEAASAYGTSNGYSCIGPDGRMSLKPELETAFETGAHQAINEFLKDLWNDAEEEPYSNLSPILLDGRDREGRQIVKTSFFRSGYWNKTVEYYGIIRWIYIDDLFPEEEEEEEEE